LSPGYDNYFGRLLSDSRVKAMALNRSFTWSHMSLTRSTTPATCISQIWMRGIFRGIQFAKSISGQPTSTQIHSADRRSVLARRHDYRLLIRAASASH
jgi:hypothetical protein